MQQISDAVMQVSEETYGEPFLPPFNEFLSNFIVLGLVYVRSNRVG